ncbi:MAG: phospholipase D-like domain-containing protein [Candidatus Paceibacterota bacterium]|jgi:hypothetical protein
MITTFQLKCRNVFGYFRHIRSNPKLFSRIIVIALITISLIVTTVLITTSYYNSQFKVVYSLDRRENDQEIIRLINKADEYVYFAIYFFTKDNIAEALIRAKERGLIVQGITDAGASKDSNKNIVEKLQKKGIVVKTQKHPDGIMHMKVLVTDKAYASGSYNWTASATNVNDEVLEVSTSNSLRKKYLEIIKKVLSVNGGVIASNTNDNSISLNDESVDVSGGTANREANGDTADLAGKLPEYSYTEALDHIGERAVVNGTVLKVFTAKSGVTFLDFCEDFKDCPFSAVIFASDLKKFPEASEYKRNVAITGTIKSYQGKAEIILNNPEQIK